jgi:hypothetical protein
MPLLTNDPWREHLARSIDDAIAAQEIRLVAFVFMPEHVHLLVYPTRRDATAQCISDVLTAAKLPCAQNVKHDLETSGSRLLARLTIRERPGRMVFRFCRKASVGGSGRGSCPAEDSRTASGILRGLKQGRRQARRGDAHFDVNCRRL